MKVTYLANGDVREISDVAARQLIDAGICTAVAEPPKKEPVKKEPQPKQPADKPTKVEPMTTEDMPVVPTKRVP
jgi:hypothetical protein